MSRTRILKNALIFSLMLGLCVPTLPAQSSTCKNNAVNQCTASCGDIGECIFGCEIGGINNLETCSVSCTGLGDPCMDSCIATVRQISNCSYVTGDITVNCGTLVYNRATSQWTQTVRVTNTNSTAPMYDAVFILDSLISGWTLTNGDGVTSSFPPAGSPYKLACTVQPNPNGGDPACQLAPNTSMNLTLVFTRNGTPAFGYMPRVITSSVR